MVESYFNDINEVTLTGRLVSDAETVEKNNKEDKSFSFVKVVIASNRKWSTKDGEEHSKIDYNTIYFNGSDMAIAAKLNTGARVYIKGRIKNREYESEGVKHHVVDIVAKKLRILDWAKPSNKEKQASQQIETTNQAE